MPVRPFSANSKNAFRPATPRELVRERFGVTVLLIEHDMKLVSGICEYLYVLNFGRLLAEGTPAEVLKNPEVVTAYLGE